MQNYLYCFDSNYNIQATCSMYSLLTNNTEQLNIYIIHKEPNTFRKYQKKLEKLNNLNELKLYNFNSDNKSYILDDVMIVKDMHVCFQEDT